MSSSSINLRVAQDCGYRMGDDFDHLRILGFTDPGRDEYIELATAPYGLVTGSTDEREVALPEPFAERLLDTLRIMSQRSLMEKPVTASWMDSDIGYNCHKFAKAMLAEPMTEWPFSSHILSLEDECSQTSDTKLALGQLGVIGVVNNLPKPDRPIHSLIGLDPASGESIQVLSNMGELVIADTERQLVSYKTRWQQAGKSGEVDLYRVEDAVIA